MIKITIIAVGKLKEKYFLAAADEYIKRLSRFCKLSIVEIEPAKISENPSPREIENCIFDEGAKFLQKFRTTLTLPHFALRVKPKVANNYRLPFKIVP